MWRVRWVESAAVHKTCEGKSLERFAKSWGRGFGLSRLNKRQSWAIGFEQLANVDGGQTAENLGNQRDIRPMNLPNIIMEVGGGARVGQRVAGARG